MDNRSDEITRKAWSLIEELCQSSFSDKMAGKNTIKTKAPKAVENGSKPANWDIVLQSNFPKHFAGLLDRFGVEVIYEACIAQLTIQFQACVRRLAEQGVSDESIKSYMASWTPGQKNPEINSIARTFNSIKKLSPEQKKELIELISKNGG